MIAALRVVAALALAQASAPSTPPIQIQTADPAIHTAPNPALSRAPALIGKPHVCAEDTYPVSAMQTGTGGNVLLGFTITAQGMVSNPVVLQSSGNADLDAASVSCAGTWLYKPAVLNGTAIDSLWRAVVKWQIAPMMPYSPIADAARSCVLSSDDGRQELMRATLHTVIRVHFSNSSMTNIAVVASSGDPDLDKRVADCFAEAPQSLVAQVTTDGDELFVMYKPGQ